MRKVATQAVGAVLSGRRGRPRADQAGEVEERVLNVATRLFLSHGFDRTTFEGLAEEAQAGKATLYARYRNKEALYEAVVRRRVAQSVARISAASDGGVSRENLLGVAMLLADEIFVPDVIALMRLTIAEVTRFPEMALATYRIGYGGCVSALAEIIAGQGHTPEMLVAATPAATRFVERVFYAAADARPLRRGPPEPKAAGQGGRRAGRRWPPRGGSAGCPKGGPFPLDLQNALGRHQARRGGAGRTLLSRRRHPGVNGRWDRTAFP